jgi:hypothetical protein
MGCEIALRALVGAHVRVGQLSRTRTPPSRTPRVLVTLASKEDAAAVAAESA